MSVGAKKILIIDGNEVYAKESAEHFEKSMGVLVATSLNQARKLLKENEVSDVYADHNNFITRLPPDKMLAWLKKHARGATVRIITKDKNVLYNQPYEEGEKPPLIPGYEPNSVIEKGFPEELAVAHRQISEFENRSVESKLDHFSALASLIPWYGEIVPTSVRIDSDGVYSLNAFTKYNPATLKCVTYAPQSIDKNKINVCVASTVGCNSGCKFCTAREWSRQHTAEEILSQVFHLLFTCYANKLSRGNQDILVRFTCEGDSVVYNLEECCRAIQIMSELKEMNFSYRMTTIGNVKQLSRLNKKYARHLKNLSLSWSLFSTNQKLRGKTMPGVAGENIFKQRDAFCEFSGITKKPFDVNYSVALDKNNQKSDVRGLCRLLKGTPSVLKLLPLVPRTLHESMYTTRLDLVRFREELLSAGIDIDVDIERILGSRTRSGCGNTTPMRIDLL